MDSIINSITPFNNYFSDKKQGFIPLFAVKCDNKQSFRKGF
jgi:hypothetical protein